eukprot:6368890-Alexandrium_andersonii.AAC.1
MAVEGDVAGRFPRSHIAQKKGTGDVRAGSITGDAKADDVATKMTALVHQGFEEELRFQFVPRA